MSLTRSTDPLVWIDCEMTGLNPASDTILSISCFVTDARLNILDPQGFDAIIHHSKEQLDAMNEWCIRTHGESGLTLACLASPTTAEQAASSLLQYVTTLVPESGKALLAGNSIHADKMFLMRPPWNQLLDHLHYRLFDVSSVKEMVRRWGSNEVIKKAPKKLGKHTAREDILESIDEARYYKSIIETTVGMMDAENGDYVNGGFGYRTDVP